MSLHPGLGAWRKQRGVASEVTLSEWAPGAGVKPEREDRACHRGVAVRNLILFAIDLERACAMLSHPHCHTHMVKWPTHNLHTGNAASAMEI